MKILFADKFPDHWQQRLRESDHDVDYRPDLDADGLAAALPGADALVVRSTRVDAAALATAGLKLVVRAGAGTNTIDRDRARELGIAVCNTPGRNAVAVAELAMGLIIALDRRIPDNVAELRRGAWNKKGFSRARGLFGTTLGILGSGAIGLELMARAAAFGMRLAVLDRPGRSETVRARLQSLGVDHYPGIGELAAVSDYLSIHLPAGESTRGLVGESVFEAMKPGAAIINTSRGEVIDESALVRAMDSKGLRAGLDVYLNEPGAGDDRFVSELASHPNVYGTHHIGASTEQAQDAVAEGVVEVIDAFAAGTVLNCVNQVA